MTLRYRDREEVIQKIKLKKQDKKKQVSYKPVIKKQINSF